MTQQKIVLSLFLTAAALSSCQGNSSEDGPSNFARAWCISGGPIYTAIDSKPQVQAVAIRKGIITYAGPNNGDWCKREAGSNSKSINLKGAAAYPGFTDAHGHLLGIGLREMTLNLEGTSSVKDTGQKIGFLPNQI